MYSSQDKRDAEQSVDIENSLSMQITNLSEHLSERIIIIEDAENKVPGHHQVFVTFKNGYEVSILQGAFTFWLYEIAVKKGSNLLDYFSDGHDQIYRTDDTNELLQIMHDVSNL